MPIEAKTVLTNAVHLLRELSARQKPLGESITIPFQQVQLPGTNLALYSQSQHIHVRE